MGLEGLGQVGVRVRRLPLSRLPFAAMGKSERPDGSLLAVLFAGAAASAIGLGLWIGSPTQSEVVVWASGAVVALAVTVLVWRGRCRVSSEDLRGVTTIVVVLTTVVALGWSVHRPFESWLWMQIVVLGVVVILSLALVATEWSRVGLLVVATVCGVLIVALVVRVGHRAEQTAVVARPLSKATTEVNALAAKADAAAKGANESARAALATALAELNESVVGAPKSFSDLGSEVWGYLSETPPNTVSARASMVRLLATDVVEENTQQSLAVRGAATAAYAAVPGAPKSAPSRAAVDSAIAAAQCAHDHSTCVEGAKPVPLSDALHDLEVTLAAYRSAVAPDDKTLKEQAVAVAAKEVKPLEISLWTTAVAGPPAIIQSVGESDSLALVPGPVGWILIGLMALMVMRSLMRINAAQMPGPVTIGEGGDAELKGVLRLAVLKNLKTPAAAPGSAVAQSITDLAGFAGPEATVLSKMFAALSNAISPTQGYVVDVDVVAGERTSTDKSTDKSTVPTKVLVRLSAASSKASVGSRIFERESAPQAMQSAGLWAAGFLLRRSTRVPSWASWTEGTAEALDTANAEAPDLAELENAARTAPSSGWVLVLYGNELELAGRTLDAVGVYARAVAAHPRYLIARYRLAVALGMSAHESAKAWTAAPLASRAALVRSLRQVAKRLDVADDLVSPLQTETDPAKIKDLARQLLATIGEDMSWWRSWAGSLRRSERSMDWLGWWSGGRRSNRSTKWLAKSAQLVYGGTEVDGVDDVVAEAQRPDSSWQVSYNLACHYAADSPTAALDALELCLGRPGIEDLKADWVEQDPDLHGIATTPRFAAFCAQLEQGGKP